MFDSGVVVLSLRRFEVEKQPTEPNLPSTVAQASVSAVKNISLPGMGDAGRLSVSPSSAGPPASTRPSALTKMMDTPEIEMSAQERFVATWNWQRHRIGVRLRSVWLIASGCAIGEAWRRIMSKCISFSVAWPEVADESHVQLAISG
jgi:hypothetical protein